MLGCGGFHGDIVTFSKLAQRRITEYHHIHDKEIRCVSSRVAPQSDYRADVVQHARDRPDAADDALRATILPVLRIQHPCGHRRGR